MSWQKVWVLSLIDRCAIFNYIVRLQWLEHSSMYAATNIHVKLNITIRVVKVSTAFAPQKKKKN
jgi:hypothetical protein